MCMQELGIDCPGGKCITCIKAKSRPVDMIPAIGGEMKLWKQKKATLGAMELEMAEMAIGKDIRNLSKFFTFKYSGTPSTSLLSKASASSPSVTGSSTADRIYRKYSDSSNSTKTESDVSMFHTNKDIDSAIKDGDRGESKGSGQE